MRPFLLVGLAACWSSTPPAATKPAPRAEPAAIAVAPPVRTYALPSPIADALAAEALAGNVLVPSGITLHATLAAARADTDKQRGGTPRAMKVLRDHGDVVEVATAPALDCGEDFDQPYQLTVFVKREKLTLRSRVEVTRSFADGTAVAIDRGAPVEISETGLAWWHAALAEARIEPDPGALAYSVPAATTAAPLPKVTGDRLVCEQGNVLTLDEYAAALRRARDEAARREQAEREQKLREAEAKQPKAKTKTTTREDVLEKSFAHAGGLDMYRRTVDIAPYCGVSDPNNAYPTPATPTPRPTVNGKPIAWPSAHNDHVVAAGAKYLADVGFMCGRVRMLVERGGLSGSGSGSGMLGGGAQIQVWVPAAGPVTWPDGTPAGTYNGNKRYRNVVEDGDRICVRVPGVAERVCHAKKPAKTEMSSAFRAD